MRITMDPTEYDDEGFELVYGYFNHPFMKRRGTKPQKIVVPEGCVKLDRPKHYSCHYFHYSNEDSQDALIKQTAGFPDWFDPATQNVAHAYSDRLYSWDYERTNRICRLSGASGDQAWAYNIPRFSDEKLKRFAKMMFRLPKLPTHVRVVHHYNVATGYSCPTICAIYPK